MPRIFVIGAILVLLIIIAVCLLIYVNNAKPRASETVSTMEGYVSRYHPGHIDSNTAWNLTKGEGSTVILDVRSEADYNDRHVSGAVNVPFESIADFASVNLKDKDITVICYCFCGDKGGSALSAYDLLAELGYSNVYYTEPGDEWTYEGATVAETAAVKHNRGIVTGNEAKEIYDSDPAVILLDVRNQDEYDEKHIEGSILIPVAELESRLSELPEKDTAIIVFCRSGRRSEMAINILTAYDYLNLYDMQAVDNWPAPLITQG